jgi:RNA polymerase sigma factor (sigma-70 family)
MATNPLEITLQQLRSVVAAAAADECTDRDLLERFARSRDEGAFAALVRRHGPLVFDVCRRVLGDRHDAEDCFQATFLVLARKAGSVRWEESVRGWLCAVAGRLAREARSRNRRRHNRERPLYDVPQPERPAELPCPDLYRVLEEQVDRLPERFRAPLRLCWLHGRTREQAARELGTSVGSVKGRLERGRELLRRRLARRGVVLPAALAGAALSPARSGAVPASLLRSTARAGVAFAAGPAGAVDLPAPVVGLAGSLLRPKLAGALKVAALALLTLGAVGPGLGVGAGQLVPTAPSTAEATPAGLVLPPPASPVAAAPRDAAPPEPPSAPQTGGRSAREVLGILRSVDARGNRLTALARDGDEVAERTLAVRRDAAIVTREGKPLGLADLRPGTKVILGLSDDRKSIVSVRASEKVSEKADAGRAPALRGTVRSVDPVKRQVTLAVRVAGATGERTLGVAEGAKVFLDGTAAEFAALKAGRAVWLELTPDGKTATAISAGGPARAGRR